MEGVVKKYQQRFRKVKDEMDKWDKLQSSLLSKFSNASSIIQRIQVIQDTKNYGVLGNIEGIEDAVLIKQMESLQSILLSSNTIMEDLNGVVSSMEKIFRDSRQLINGSSGKANTKHLQQQVGLKPSPANCLDGLRLLADMHRSEYKLKLSIVSALSSIALKPSASHDLNVLQRLLVDQPNINREEVKYIFDIILAEEIS